MVEIKSKNHSNYVPKPSEKLDLQPEQLMRLLMGSPVPYTSLAQVR